MSCRPSLALTWPRGGGGGSGVSFPNGWLELRSRLRQSRVVVVADKGRFDFSAGKGLETYGLLFAQSYPAFHPKLCLLAFDKTFRLIVSSANLTKPGYHSNLEVVWMASTEQGDRFGQAAREAVEFLESVRRQEWPDSHIMKDAVSALRARIPRSKGTARLLHSASKPPILRQWRILMGDSRKIDEIHVLAPFFDRAGKLPALHELGASQVHFYLAGKEEKGENIYPLPVAEETIERIKPECHAISVPWMLRGEETIAAGAGEERWSCRRSRYLHAKVYAVRIGNRGHLLLGSTNFTVPALLASGNHRNAEAAIAISGPWRDIRRYLPAVSHDVPWQEVKPAPGEAEEDRGPAAWTPFLLHAEYSVGDASLELAFASRDAKGAWRVAYGETERLAGAGFKRFPRVQRMPFKLDGDPFLGIEEGKHAAKFPITVVDKELLPEYPGIEALSYGEILQQLAHGVVNMRQAYERLRRSRQKVEERPQKENTPRVAFMDRLALFMKAMERMKAKMECVMITPAEARALFDGDQGFNRIVEGVCSDAGLEKALRHTYLLEFVGLLASVRWSGASAARRLAGRLAGRSMRRIRKELAKSEADLGTDAKRLAKVRRLYGSDGGKGWCRP